MNLPALCAFLGRELAHVFAELREDAFAPQHFHAHGFQLFGVSRRPGFAPGRYRRDPAFIYGCGQIGLLRPAQFPAQMIQIKQHQHFRIFALEVLIGARLPALGQILLRVQILREKTFFVRHAEKIQHCRDHVHVRNQNGLRKVGGKLLVLLVQPLPEAGRGFAQTLGIHLRQMRAES